MPVSRIAVGAGNRVTGSSTTLAASDTCNTATSGANVYALVGVVQSVSTNHTDTSATVTYGGVAMTQHKLSLSGSTTNRAAVSLYYLANPPTGSQTVTATSTGAGTKMAIGIMTAVYGNVSSLDAAVSDIGGTGSTNVASAVGNKVFAVATSSADITSVNQTQLYDAFSTVAGSGDAINVSDANGAPTVTFTYNTALNVVAVDINAAPGGKLINNFVPLTRSNLY